MKENPSMNAPDWLASPIVVRLGWTLLHSLWQGAAVAACAAASFALLRRHAPAIRYLVACAALALMVLLPAITFVCLAPSAPASLAFSGAPAAAPQPPAMPPPAIDSISAPAGPAISHPPAAQPAPPATHITSPAPWTFNAQTLDRFLPWATFAWMAGVLALSLWRIGGWLALQRLRGLPAPALPPHLAEAFVRLTRQMGIRRLVKLITTSRVESALLLGWLKPVILIPPALVTGLSPQQLEAILAHELAHIRRHDYLALLLQTALETLLFYHPATWWLSRRISLEREQCCDDLAATTCGNPREYASALASLEALCLPAMPTPALGAAGRTRYQLLPRIARLLGVELQPKPATGAITGFAALLALLLVASIALRANAQAEPPGTVTVTVRAADTGKPLPGIPIQMRAGISTNRRMVTDDAGQAKLILQKEDAALGMGIRVGEPRGTPIDNWVPASATWRPSATQPAPPSKVNIVLEKPTTIGGKVVDQDGHPIDGAIVGIYAYKEYAAPQELQLTEEVRTDAQGHWQFTGVPAKTLKLNAYARHPEFLNQTDADSLPTEQQLRAGTAVLKLTRGVPIHGKIVGAEGPAVQAAKINIGDDITISAPDTFYSREVQGVRINADGTFTLGGRASTKAVILVRVPGFAPDLQHFTVNKEPVSVTFTLKPAATLSGKVVDAQGNPIANALVGIDSWRGVGGLYTQFRTDLAGIWTWNDAPDDDVVIDALAPGHASVRNAKVRAGQDNIITLGPTTLFKGKVVDADTGKPITDYDVKTGVPVENGFERVSWDGVPPQLTHPGAAPGEFEVRFDEPKEAMIVRVEANGYLFLESPKVPVNGKETQFTFKMRKDPAGPRNNAVEGRVLGLDGQPLKGAKVYIAENRHPIWLHPELKILHETEFQTPAITDDQGHFAFKKLQSDWAHNTSWMPEMGYCVVVWNDSGAASVSAADFAKSPTLHLQKWGRIEGEVRAGTHPIAGAKVHLNVFAPSTPDEPESRAYDHAGLVTDGDVVTDAAGTFSSERMTPGTATAFLNDHSTRSSLPVQVLPGQTAHLRIGGSGTPVAGHITFNDPRLEGAAPGRVLLVRRFPPEFPIPAEVMEKPFSEFRAWQREISSTDEAKKYEQTQAEFAKTPTGYAASINPDATFRIEDIPPGTYDLDASATIGSNRSGNANVAGIGNAHITIPAPPGGVTDTPISVGDIHLFYARELQPGDPAPDVTLPTLDGKSISPAALKGKLVLVVNWLPVYRELLPAPAVKTLWEAHRNDPRFAIVGLLPEGEADNARRYLAAHPTDWPQAIYSSRTPISHNFPGFPETAQGSTSCASLIGPDGKLLATKLKPDQIQAAVEKALAK
jgi:beta-lactamase regulating signal transducer with metallopeptidase domain/protocatechuate 3,4-dioxygenase beta subunit